jgi:hypothetical protein
MDTVATYRSIVEQVLTHYIEVTYAYGDIQNEAIFDRGSDRYAIMSVGWQGVKRIHGCLIHIDIVDGKVWIQRDGTEDGIAHDLVAAGIPRQHIVLGFQSSDVRVYTEFAVA